MNDPEKKARQLRKKIFQICVQSGGHISTSFSCVDILATLYYSDVFKFDSGNPDWKNRDHLILSKGHAETALYVILADVGYFPEEWLFSRYRKGDCFLGGHPDKQIPGVEVTTGALGHGLGVGAGISLAGKFNKLNHFQFVLLGDAECTEGSIWESAIFASKHKLNTLVAIIDRNNIGALDFTSNFTALEPLIDKWTAFGWEVKVVDGHNYSNLLSCYKYSIKRLSEKPLVIIANTIKGKGVSFMENNPSWHTKTVSTKEEIKIALRELEL